MSKNKSIIAFVGTYPPRECGIATFTQDLLQSTKEIVGHEISCKVAALNHSPLDHYVYPPEVAWQISKENNAEYQDLAAELNNNSLVAGVIIQHEYGIFGGNEGEHILDLVENCTKPILVTLHTVLPNPSLEMKAVTTRIINRANIIVVLTQDSRHILETVYPFSVGKVFVIPHGVHFTEFTSTKKAKKKLKFSRSTILSTFGLMSRGKGIEYVIKALPEIIRDYHSVLYLVLGETHPSVRREEGEKYRLELAELVTELNLKDHVKFSDQYHSLDELLEFLKATDIYISTSINPNQAVSGTLSYALGAGRAVVSTAFAQSKEIIKPENGRLVPVQDSKAISDAVKEILRDPEKLAEMHQHAYRSTRAMLWSNVATEYSDLLLQLVLAPINLAHVIKMTDDFGLIQFAIHDTPDTISGYTLDDNARALVVCNSLLWHDTPVKEIKSLLSTYLDFVEVCQKEDGTFVNYIGFEPKTPTSQNTTEDISDATARAVWSLAETFSNQHVSTAVRNKAKKLFLRSLPSWKTVPHLRSKAFMIKGLVKAYDHLPRHQQDIALMIEELTASLIENLEQNSSASWHWFEDHLSYNSAVLPEGLMMGATFLKNKKYLKQAVASLQFLIDETFSTNMYAPIGHFDWYQRDGKRGLFDQQPEDPAAMVMALRTSYKLTGQQSYKNLAHKCFSWFLGNNTLHQSLYDYQTGGCYDGLHPDRVNLNQGAESLISYLLARLAISEIDAYEHTKNSKHFS